MMQTIGTTRNSQSTYTPVVTDCSFQLNDLANKLKVLGQQPNVDAWTLHIDINDAASGDRAAALQQALTLRNRTSSQATSWQSAASDDPQCYPEAAVLPP